MKPRLALFVCFTIFATSLLTAPTHAADDDKFLVELGIRNACPYEMEALLILNVLDKDTRFGWKTYKAGDPKHHYILAYPDGLTVIYNANKPAYIFFRVKDYPQFDSKGGDYPVTFDGKRMMVRIPEAATDRTEHATGIALVCPEAEKSLHK